MSEQGEVESFSALSSGDKFIQRIAARWWEYKISSPRHKPEEELKQEQEEGVNFLREMLSEARASKEIQSRFTVLNYIEQRLRGDFLPFGKIEFGSLKNLGDYLRQSFSALVWEPIIDQIEKIRREQKGSYVQRIEEEEHLRKMAAAGPGDAISQRIKEQFAASKFTAERVSIKRTQEFINSLELPGGFKQENLSQLDDYSSRLEKARRKFEKLLKGGKPLIPEGKFFSVASGRRDERGLDINVFVSASSNPQKLGDSFLEIIIKDNKYEEKFKVWGSQETLKIFSPEERKEVPAEITFNIEQEKELIEAFLNDKTNKFTYEAGRLPSFLSFLERVFMKVEKQGAVFSKIAV